MNINRVTFKAHYRLARIFQKAKCIHSNSELLANGVIIASLVDQNLLYKCRSILWQRQ